MGITKTIEYAFIVSTGTSYNQEYIDGEEVKYRHVINCHYDLFDVSMQKIGSDIKKHEINTVVPTVMDTIAQGKTLIEANIYEWIRQDKIELADFDIGPEL